MEKVFLCGLALGMLTGALIVANSVKARKMVMTGQEEAVQKVEELTKKAEAKVRKNGTKKAEGEESVS